MLLIRAAIFVAFCFIIPPQNKEDLFWQKQTAKDVIKQETAVNAKIINKAIVINTIDVLENGKSVKKKEAQPLEFERTLSSSVLHTQYFFDPKSLIINSIYYDWEISEKQNDNLTIDYFDKEYTRIESLITSAYSSPLKRDSVSIKKKGFNGNDIWTRKSEWHSKQNIFLELIYSNSTKRIRAWITSL
jgi:hypothetical protein